MKYFTYAVVFFGFFSSTVNADEVDVKPGLWKTTYKMKVYGVPPQFAAMMEQSQNSQETECVKDNKVDFMPSDMGEHCTYKKHKKNKKKLTFSFSCSQEDGSKSEGRGEINYKSTSVSGWVNIKSNNPQMGPMKMRNSFTGKRIGNC